MRQSRFDRGGCRIGWMGRYRSEAWRAILNSRPKNDESRADRNKQRGDDGVAPVRHRAPRGTAPAAGNRPQRRRCAGGRLRSGRALLGAGHRRHPLRALPRTRRAARHLREDGRHCRDPATHTRHAPRLAPPSVGRTRRPRRPTRSCHHAGPGL